MAKPKRLKVQTEKIETRERAEAVVGEIAAKVIERDAVTAELESDIQDVRSRYEARLLECSLVIEQKMPAVEAWAEEHPELFEAKKSLQMVHGLIGFRTGNPKCSPLRGWTWEKVKAHLVNKNLGYTRTVVEVDREGFIRDRDTLKAAGLAERGVEVYQEDSFYLEPKREEKPG
jgi:phage host-nuclease inhibitor protein Gam